MTVGMDPAPWQTPAQVEADIERSFRLAEQLEADGTERWQSRYRRVGAARAMVTKEVGPPPWPRPRLRVTMKRDPWFVSFGVGWRMTAYQLHLMWHRADG